MIRLLASLTLNHSKGALASLILVTLLLAVPGAQVGVDNSVDVWFVEGDAALERYKAFQTRYGNDELVAIAVDEPDGVFTPTALNRLLALSNRLEAIDGVDQVFSIPRALLTEVHTAQGSGSGGDRVETLDIRRAMTEPVTQRASEQLQAAIAADPLLANRFTGSEDTVAMLLVQMDSMEDIDAERHRILSAIDAVLEEETKTLSHVAGIGVVYDALNQISQTEGAMFMGAAFLVIFVLLYPLFRSLRAVGVAAGAVSCAVIMTRGAYGLAGGMENMVTMTLPVLVLILGVADCVHILRYVASRQDIPSHEAFGRILVPCFYTTLTTMVGFGALATSQMAVVRQLGIFAAAGIGFAFISSAICCGAALKHGWLRIAEAPQEPAERLDSWFRWTSKYATNRRELVLGVSVLSVLFGAYGLAKVDVDTYSIGFLHEDHTVRQDSAAMEQKFGPYTPLEFELVSTQQDASEPMLDPAILRAVFGLQRELPKAFPDSVRDSLSLANVVARLHQVNGGEGTPYEVPDDATMVAVNVEMYRGDPDAQLERMTDGAFRRLRLTVQVPMLSARGYETLIEELLTFARARLPETVEIEATGYLPLYVKMMEYVVRSQVQSFGWAFVLVFLLVGLLFRSIRMSAISIVPNVLPIFITLGAMGALGINLDVATVTIASIVIGIVVDDTIHYLHRYRAELEHTGGDYEQAAENTAVAIGRSVGSTSLIFALGFSVLTLASIKSIVYFGLLAALAMLIALLADLFILPALLVTLRPALR